MADKMRLGRVGRQCDVRHFLLLEHHVDTQHGRHARRMVETAAHLVDHVLPPLPVRQWVLSVPKRLRPFLHHNPRAVLMCSAC